MTNKLIVTVDHQKLSLYTKTYTVDNTVGFLEIQFKYRSDEWSDIDRYVVFGKGAIKSVDEFSLKNTPYTVKLDDSNSCIVPYEVMHDTDAFSIGTFGMSGDNIIPTNWLVIDMARGCYVLGETPGEPPIDIYMELLKDIETAQADIENIQGDIEVINEHLDTLDKQTESAAEDISQHSGDFNNPHKTTAEQTGALPIEGGHITGDLSVGKNLFVGDVQTSIGEKNFIVGEDNIVGTKAFEISDYAFYTIDDEGNRIYNIIVKNVDDDGNRVYANTNELSSAIGKYYYMKIDYNYPHVGEILEVRMNQAGDIRFTVDGIFTNDTSPMSYDDDTAYAMRTETNGLIFNTYNLKYAIDTPDLVPRQNRALFIENAPELGTFVYHDHSAAIGDGNVVQGDYAIAQGVNNSAVGRYASAHGNNNTADFDCHVFGRDNNTEKAFDCFVAGKANKVVDERPLKSGDEQLTGSSALGTALRVGYPHQTVVGKYNDNHAEDVFEVGFGTHTNRKNLFSIKDDGSQELILRTNIDANSMLLTEDNLPIDADYIRNSSTDTFPVTVVNNAQYRGYVQCPVSAGCAYLVVGTLRIDSYTNGKMKLAPLYSQPVSPLDQFGIQTPIEELVPNWQSGHEYTFCYMKTLDSASTITHLGFGFKNVAPYDSTCSVTFTSVKAYPMAKIGSVELSDHQVLNPSNLVNIEDLFIDGKTNYTVLDQYLYGVPGNGATFKCIVDSHVVIGDGRIQNLQDPQNDSDVATKRYTDKIVEEKLNKNGDTMHGDLLMDGNCIEGVGKIILSNFYDDDYGDMMLPPRIEVPDSSHLDVKGSVNFNTGTVTLNGANIKYPSIHSIPNNPSNTQLVPFKTVKDYVDTYHGNGTVIGSAGFVYGTNSSVGGKGMPIVDYNGTIGEEGTYTLSNVTQEFADRIAIGDIVSIVMKGNFDCWSKVTSVVYEAANEIIKLTVDTFFTNEKDVSTGDTTSYDAHKTYSSSGKLTYAPEMGFAIQNPSEKQVYIYIVGKPDVGSVLLADGGASFGEDVIVQGKDSFGSGYNIWVGKYAAAIGKNVKAAYGDFAAGRDIDLSEAQVSSAMGNNLKIGGFASGTTLFGQYLESNRSNQTVVGTYNNFRYDDVFEIGAGNTSGRKNAFAVDQYGLIWSNEGLIADQLLTETLSTSKMVMADNMVTGNIVTKTSDVTADTQACIPLYNSTHTQGNGSVYMYVDGSKLGCQDGKYYVVGLTMFMNNLVATDKKPVFFGKAKGTSMNTSVRADGSFKESPVQIGNNDLRVVFKYDSTTPIMCIYLDAYGRTNNVYWDLSTSDLFVYQLNPISSWFKSKDSFSSGYVPVYEHATGHSVNECIFNNTDGLGIYDVGGLPYLATTEASSIRLDLYTANAKSYKEKQLEARIAALEAKIS